MVENFISFLKDDSTISILCLYFIAGIIVILILKSLLKSTKIKPKVFDSIIFFASILFLIFVVSNATITENYNRLWNIILVFIGIILQQVLPILVKWYDGKIDKLSEKL